VVAAVLPLLVQMVLLLAEMVAQVQHQVFQAFLPLMQVAVAVLLLPAVLRDLVVQVVVAMLHQ
jgi:hypothetical protein